MSRRKVLAVAVPALAIMWLGAFVARSSTESAFAPRVVTVIAKDYAFDAPDTIEAGAVTFRLENKGTDLHHVWLIRLQNGKTMADVEAALKSGEGGFPTWVVNEGGPNAAVPGAESNATVVLEPGNYALLCVIPASDGQPHMMKGMVRPLTVVRSDGESTELPASDVQITLADYGFQFSKALTAGRHVILFRNVASQPHEAVLVQLAPGKSVGELAAWLEKREGPPPGRPIGGISGIDKGVENTIEVDLQPGEYGLICFVPDAKDGKPHIAHGMVTQFTVR